MRATTLNLYQFDEAKERARDWYREASAGDADISATLDDAVEVAALMGIEIDTDRQGRPIIYYSAGHVQGDYAAFEGSYRYRKGAAKAVRDYASQDAELHRIAQALQAIQARNFYQLTASCSVRRDWQEVSVDRADDAAMTPDADDEITELMRDFAAWIYDQLIAEVDYQSSDEYVDEAMEANGYEFTKNGRIA